jgi:hypothetical protein
MVGNAAQNEYQETELTSEWRTPVLKETPALENELTAEWRIPVPIETPAPKEMFGNAAQNEYQKMLRSMRSDSQRTPIKLSLPKPVRRTRSLPAPSKLHTWPEAEVEHRNPASIKYEKFVATAQKVAAAEAAAAAKVAAIAMAAAAAKATGAAKDQAELIHGNDKSIPRGWNPAGFKYEQLVKKATAAKAAAAQEKRDAFAKLAKIHTNDELQDTRGHTRYVLQQKKLAAYDTALKKTKAAGTKAAATKYAQFVKRKEAVAQRAATALKIAREARDAKKAAAQDRYLAHVRATKRNPASEKYQKLVEHYKKRKTAQDLATYNDLLEKGHAFEELMARRRYRMNIHHGG